MLSCLSYFFSAPLLHLRSFRTQCISSSSCRNAFSNLRLQSVFSSNITDAFLRAEVPVFSQLQTHTVALNLFHDFVSRALATVSRAFSRPHSHKCHVLAARNICLIIRQRGPRPQPNLATPRATVPVRTQGFACGFASSRTHLLPN